MIKSSINLNAKQWKKALQKITLPMNLLLNDLTLFFKSYDSIFSSNTSNNFNQKVIPPLQCGWAISFYFCILPLKTVPVFTVNLNVFCSQRRFCLLVKRRPFPKIRFQDMSGQKYSDFKTSLGLHCKNEKRFFIQTGENHTL